MKLITELLEDSIQSIIEEDKETGIKKHFIEGVFMQSDVKNRNGRVYPKKIMEAELKEYQKLIDAKRSLSELGHPATPQINLDRVSHIITELKFNGSDVFGKAKILGTPMGNIAKNLLDEGVKLGVSSRGMGTVKLNNQGINEVQSDFRLAGIDIVSDPSGPDCFVNGIMEGIEFWYKADGTLVKETIAEQAKVQINQAVRNKKLDDMKYRLFEDYMKKVSKI